MKEFFLFVISTILIHSVSYCIEPDDSLFSGGNNNSENSMFSHDVLSLNKVLLEGMVVNDGIVLQKGTKILIDWPEEIHSQVTDALGNGEYMTALVSGKLAITTLAQVWGLYPCVIPSGVYDILGTLVLSDYSISSLDRHSIIELVKKSTNPDPSSNDDILSGRLYAEREYFYILDDHGFIDITVYTNCFLREILKLCNQRQIVPVVSFRGQRLTYQKRFVVNELISFSASKHIDSCAYSVNSFQDALVHLDTTVNVCANLLLLWSPEVRKYVHAISFGSFPDAIDDDTTITRAYYPILIKGDIEKYLVKFEKPTGIGPFVISSQMSMKGKFIYDFTYDPLGDIVFTNFEAVPSNVPNDLSDVTQTSENNE